ncbi:MAG: ATP-binding protein [Chloroflexota bacterium]|nr:ATP-binding protein [Chloroflexota bacterium]
MSSALDSVPGGVLSLSSDLRIVGANEAMGALVGRPVNDFVGALFDTVLSAPSRILFQTHVYPALEADGRVEEVFLTVASATGEAVPVLLNATRSSRAIGATYDVLIVRVRARALWEADLLAATRSLERERTASQRLAAELAASAEDLAARYAEEQRAREFRDAFVGVIAHELRTPITTIYGMSHVLAQRHASMDPEVTGRHLHDIEAEADRLRRLTEDLLVLSRAEGRRLMISSDPVAIAHVVNTAVESERMRFTAHEFLVAAPPGLPGVLGEEVYVEQVVRNYLSNAAKYSPPRTTIRVDLTAEGDGVAVRVTDEGPGFSDGAPERLFDLFYRAADVIGRTPGAGIGLFVCRELIKAMGGRVWARAATTSETGGAEFGFWLPAATDDD